jgi:anti-anti-sigma factor
MDERDCALFVRLGSRLGWIHIAGELDAHTAPEFGRAVTRLIEGQQAPEIIVDMSSVDFMDSSGLGSLIGCYKAARQRGKSVRVESPSPSVARILEITGQYKRFVEGVDRSANPVG